MHPEPIRDPESIQLPDRVEEVFAALTANGAKEFTGELIAAIRKGKERGDFRPLQDVIDAWYRSLLFARTTSHVEEEELQENVNRILESDAPGSTLEEVRRELKLSV